MTTKKFQMISSLGAGIITSFVALLVNPENWGRGWENWLPFACLAAAGFAIGFALIFFPQELWGKIAPEGYKKFEKKITSTFCRLSADICED